MATLSEIRQKYPQYNDLSDETLADRLYQKYYSDMPRDQFNQKIGLSSQEKTSALGAFVRQGAQGGSLGFSDELVGAGSALPAIASNIVRSVVPGQSSDWSEVAKDYRAGRDAERALLDAAGKEHPSASLAGQGAGIVGSLFLPGGLIAKAATKVIPALKGTTALAGIPRAAATGTGWGATDALGHSTADLTKGEIPQALTDTAIGAAAGAAGGAALHKLGQYASPIATWVGSKLPFVRNNIPSGAVKRLAKDLEEAGIKDIPAALEAKGEGAMLLDVAPSFAKTAEEAAVSGVPAARNTLDKALNAREEGTTGRLYRSVNEAIGKERDYEAYIDRLVKNRRDKTQELYEQSGNVTTPLNSKLYNLMTQVPAVRKAGQKADIQTMNMQLPLSDKGVTVRDLHLRMQDLEDVASAAKRAGKYNEGRVADDLRRQIREYAEKASPEFAKAQRIYSEESRILDAAGRAGYGKSEGTAKLLFDDSVTPKALLNRWAKMGTKERAALKARVRQEVQHMAGTSRKDMDIIIGAFEKPYVYNKAKFVLGEAETNRLVERLKNEKAFKNTKNQILGGSQTAERLARQKEDMANPRNWPSTAIDLLSSALRGFSGAPYRDRQAELARLLTTSSGPELEGLVKALKGIQQKNKKNSLLPAQRIGGLIGSKMFVEK